MPAMNEVFKLEPSTSGCDLESCGIIGIYFLGAIEELAVLIIPISIFIIGVIYTRRNRYIIKSGIMSKNAMKLNRMLMIAMLAHILIIVVFLVVPVMVLYAFMLFGNERQNLILEIIIVIFTCHSLLDIPAMMVLIKPYRMFILEMLIWCIKKISFGRLFNSDQVQILLPHSTTLQS